MATVGNLVPAKIFEVDSSGNRKGGGISVDCMFNPFEYTVSKSNTYEEKSRNNSNVPAVEFKKGGPQSLRLSLTFDTYEKSEDVSLITNKLWKFMESTTRQGSGQDDSMLFGGGGSQAGLAGGIEVEEDPPVASRGAVKETHRELFPVGRERPVDPAQAVSGCVFPYAARADRPLWRVQARPAFAFLMEEKPFPFKTDKALDRFVGIHSSQ